MPYDLTDQEILEMLHHSNGGATYYEIAEKSPQDIGREQGRYAIDRLKNQGYDIEGYKDENNPKKTRFFYTGELEQTNDPVNHTEKKRISTTSKQTISKKANEALIELEKQIKDPLSELEPITWDKTPKTSENGEDLIIHETDVHFGDTVTNKHGEKIYNSEIAEQRVRNRFKKIMEIVEQKRNNGTPINTVHLLLGGDLTTNEAIYDGQGFKVDETIKEQLKRAEKVYTEVLYTLSQEFDHVQVVCNGGNHGEFRIKGNSDDANADDFLYDRLESTTHVAQKRYDDMHNTQFIKSDRTDHLTFQFRGAKYTGFLTHGDNRSFHVGTSSPQSDWLAYKDHEDLDAAWRGHFHDWRIERVNGAPICMTPSQKPPGDFEEQHGVYSEPENVIYFSSDDQVISEIETFPVDQ